MNVTIPDILRTSPDHLARLAAESERIAREWPEAQRQEKELAAKEKAERKRRLLIAFKRTAKRVRIRWLGHWLAKIDRLNAMARNPGCLAAK